MENQEKLIKYGMVQSLYLEYQYTY